MNWAPGQHAFIILPTISTLPFEAHPFTIASISSSDEEASADDEHELTFIIRARDGFTKRLRADALGEVPVPIKAFIDGPYGCPPSLAHYSTCVLISGVYFVLMLIHGGN